MGSARDFAKLVFQPLPKVWGVVTVGIPAVVVALLWSFEYGLWAAGIFLVALVILLGIAGYRLQRQLNAPSRVVLVSPPLVTEGYRKVWLPGFLGQPGREGQVQDSWRFVIAQRAGGVHLECRKWGEDVPEDAECWVEDPDGDRHQGNLRRAQDSTLRCTYPEDFGVDPTQGPHHVHWSCLYATGDSGEMRRDAMYDPLDFTIELQREPR